MEAIRPVHTSPRQVSPRPGDRGCGANDEAEAAGAPPRGTTLQKGVGLRPPTSARSSSADSALLAAMSSRAVRRHWAVAVHDDPQQPALPGGDDLHGLQLEIELRKHRTQQIGNLAISRAVLRSGWVRQLCATTHECGSAGPDGAVSQHTRAALEYGRRMASSGAPASLPFGPTRGARISCQSARRSGRMRHSDPAINEPRINSSGAISPPADSPSARHRRPPLRRARVVQGRHSNRR